MNKVNDYIQQQLDMVLKLAKEKQQVINQIRSKETKKLGLFHLAVSAEEKEHLVARARKLFDSRIANIYKQINEELKNSGQEEIQNPFEVNKEGEINNV